MAEIVLVVGTEKVAARDFDPALPVWFAAFEQGREPSPESVLTLGADECPEPEVKRVTPADCEPTTVIASSSRLYFNFLGR